MTWVVWYLVAAAVIYYPFYRFVVWRRNVAWPILKDYPTGPEKFVALVTVMWWPLLPVTLMIIWLLTREEARRG
jgi:hypothetical protein